MREAIGPRRMRTFAAVVPFLALGLAGCGSSSSVSGTVSYKGTPLRGGTVTFYSAGNWTGTSTISPEGTYKIDHVPPGPVKIAVETKTAQPPKPPPNMPRPPKDAPVPKGSIYDTESQGKNYVPIPDKYGDKDQSGLTYEVKSGRQEHKIDLE